jgi:Flp pilus assembly protein TadG
MPRAWWARFMDQSGAELVEAALVMVYLFTLLIGIVWLGRAYNIYATMTRAAREGARYAVAPPCAMCGGTYPSGGSLSSCSGLPASTATVADVVSQALCASSLDPTAVSGWSAVTSTGQGTLVTVTFSYPVPTVLPSWLLIPSLTLSTKVQMQSE